MLQELEDITIKFKLRLIHLGLELPPAVRMTISLLKQIDMDFKQMSNVISGSYSTNLFTNAETVILQTTGQWHPIHNLQTLMAATVGAERYIRNY
jgi:hypothetical protein|tara:strand:- start:630 stop:914 length:285 start_codon:yes stop_codon:yes gene_type:complete